MTYYCEVLKNWSTKNNWTEFAQTETLVKALTEVTKYTEERTANWLYKGWKVRIVQAPFEKNPPKVIFKMTFKDGRWM